MEITEHRNWRGLKSVTSESVRAYLLNHEWQPVPYKDERCAVFQLKLNDGDRALLLLPVNTKLSDFYQRLSEAIDLIARLEDQPTYVVLQRFVVQEESSDTIYI